MPKREPAFTSGYGGLALLRLGLAASMAVFAITYQPKLGLHLPAGLVPKALTLALLPIPIAVAHLIGKLRYSRRLAPAGLAVDAAAVLGTLALFAFDPRRFILALIVVVHAEAGAVLGLPAGIWAWAGISGAYVAVESLSVSLTGAPGRAARGRAPRGSRTPAGVGRRPAVRGAVG